MAAIPRDEEASSVPACRWRLRSRSPIRSRAALNLAHGSERFFLEMRSKRSRRPAVERLRNRRNMLGSISTATTRDVDQPSPCEVAQITGHVLRAKIEPGLRKRIRQTGVGIA